MRLLSQFALPLMRSSSTKLMRTPVCSRSGLLNRGLATSGANHQSTAKVGKFVGAGLGVGAIGLGGYWAWQSSAGGDKQPLGPGLIGECRERIQQQQAIEGVDGGHEVEHSSVVIIGSGLAGLGCGLHLEGDVTIVDREKPGAISQASVLNTGMVLPYEKKGIWQSLGIATLKFLKNMHDEGEKIDFNMCGSLLVAQTDEQMIELRDMQIGSKSRLVEQSELREIEPELSHDLKGAILTEEEACVDPRKVVRSLVNRFLSDPRHQIKENHEVREIVVEPNGWLIRGIRLGHRTATEGETFEIRTPKLVLACGPMAAFFGEQLDLTLPIVPVAGNVLRTESSDSKVKRMVFALESHSYWKENPTEESPLVPPCVTHKSMNGDRLTRHLYGRQLSDGTFIFGGDRRVHPQQGPSLAHKLPRSFPEKKSHREMFLNSPAVRETRIFAQEVIPSMPESLKDAWGGVMSFSCDGTPILGEVESSDVPEKTEGKLYLILGFGPKGMSTAIEGGRRVALQIQGEEADLKGAEPSRFFEKHT